MMRAQRGQTIPFVALVLTVLIGMVGVSVDVGYYRYDQRIQQTATDSAATAGAAELPYSTSSATDAAKADASANGFTDGAGSTTVTVNPAYSDTYTTGTSAVQVTISKSYPRFFSGVFGSSNVTITTTAVARAANTGQYCLYQLKSSGAPNFNGMTFNAPACGIIMNGTGNFTGAHVTASVIGYASTPPTVTGATFSEATPAPALPAIDPCPHIPGCNYIANNTPSASGCVSGSYNGQTVTLNPGCYGAMNFNAATVTLNSGLYVINGNWNVNGATIKGTGVTFYGTSSSCVNFNGASLQASPPTSGNYQGVLIYQSPSTSSGSCNPNFNGASQSIAGLLYYPSLTVNFNGSLGNYTVLVVNDVNFNGSTQNFPSPPPNSSYVQQPTLAE